MRTDAVGVCLPRDTRTRRDPQLFLGRDESWVAVALKRAWCVDTSGIASTVMSLIVGVALIYIDAAIYGAVSIIVNKLHAVSQVTRTLEGAICVGAGRAIDVVAAAIGALVLVRRAVESILRSTGSPPPDKTREAGALE